jgi:hypothetical protein
MKPKIATANGLTRGQVSAILIKIAQQLGMEDIKDAAEMFLRGTAEIVVKKILDMIGIVKTSATSERFVAKDMFKLKKDRGICSYLDDNFESWFLAGEGKVENAIPEGELRYGKLTKVSVDDPIIEELGGETKAETALTEMFDLMSKQPKGEEGTLLTNGYANIFYVRDLSGVLRAVFVLWNDDGWHVDAYSVEGLHAWSDGRRVFSRNS